MPPSRFEQVLVTANRAIIVLMMSVMATLVFVNVVCRYIFNFSIIWAEEISQYLMIWITYLGAGLALREGRHVTVDVLQDRLPRATRRLVRAAIATGMLGFLVVLAILGVRIAAFTWKHETPVLNLPLGLPYLAIPAGAVIMGLHLALVFRNFVDGRFEHAEPAGAE
jgi:TRAP-type C4-dicarboxylate transport system permease small subunit